MAAQSHVLEAGRSLGRVHAREDEIKVCEANSQSSRGFCAEG